MVGRLAAHKGIPLLTGLGDVIIDERAEYRTLIRTSYDLRDKARAVLAFLAHHDWYQFGMIYRYQDIYYSTLADELFSLSQQRNKKSQYRSFNCRCRYTYNRDQNKRIVTNLESIMDKMKSCARSMFI